MKRVTLFSAATLAVLLACEDPTRGNAPVTFPSLNVEWELVSTIVFVSTRDDPADPWGGAEVYLMNGDGTNARRVTENTAADFLPALSPDGKKIVFDSNRLRAEGEPINISDLFVMKADGTEEEHLVRGSSGSWSPDSRKIAFHASASGTGELIRIDPGSATDDSDIFVMNVDDVLESAAAPTNITNNAAAVDEDPDWSPAGTTIVFTSHAVTDNHLNPLTAEIYAINADGTGVPVRLTYNLEEERGPSWSPDGTRIVYACRRGPPPRIGAPPTFEICVMNADGTDQVRLTDNTLPDLTPTWSADGQKIVFHRPVAGRAQLWLMNSDGTGQIQLTDTAGLNLLASWGGLRVRGQQ